MRIAAYLTAFVVSLTLAIYEARGQVTPWLVQSGGDFASALAGGEDNAVLGIACTSGIISVSLWLPREKVTKGALPLGDLRLHLASGQPGEGFFLKLSMVEDRGAQVSAATDLSPDYNYVVREAIEALLGSDGPVWAGLWLSNDSAGRVLFPAEGKNEALRKVLTTCGVETEETSFSEGEWTVKNEAGSLSAGVASGRAELKLTLSGCEAVKLLYSFPAADLHRDLAKRNEVDVVVARDGRNEYAYVSDVALTRNSSEVSAGFAVPYDKSPLEEISRAGRTVDISLSRDAGGSSQMLNRTRFSAKGSTAAVKQLRQSCGE